MKARTIEAEKIEKDYMLRLKKSIAQYNAIEAVEIEQDVVEHIEEAVNELGNGEVSVTQMANVLEKLGPPEIYAEEVGAENLKANPKRENPSKPANQSRKPEAPSKEEIPAFTKLLDKLWLGFLISIIGLFIPIIDLSVCSIIGSIIIAFAVFNYKGKYTDGIGSVGILSIIEVLLMLCASFLIFLGLLLPFIGILQLLVVFPLLIISFVIYWKVLSKCATVLQLYKINDIAESVRTKRNIGLALSIVMVCVLFLVGVGVGFLGMAVDKEMGIHNLSLTNALLGDALIILCLPLFWLFGWLFTLRPITDTRKALREMALCN